MGTDTSPSGWNPSCGEVRSPTPPLFGRSCDEFLGVVLEHVVDLVEQVVDFGLQALALLGRLLRALYEYFVGGIKTNISLFRRILMDPDFRAGNLDTGFLDRLLAKPSNETDPRRPIVAAIGAAIFASLEPKATLPGANGAAQMNGNAAPPPASNWRRAARVEAVREG